MKRPRGIGIRRALRPRLLVFVALALAMAGAMAAGTAGRALADVTCGPGYYSNGSTCVPADPGYIVPFAGATSEMPCLAGTWQPGWGETVCWLAPPGTYVPGQASATLIPCSPGTYQPNDQAFACISADPGYYAAGYEQTQETACPPGTYQPGPGAQGCDIADPGDFVSGTGQASETQCAAGTYQASAGAAGCASADPGSYVATSGATGETSCPAGTYQANAGAVTCVAASVNYYVPGVGATAQVACPAGTDQPSTGQASCVPLMAAQTISWQTVPGQIVGATPDISADAAASSGLPVSFASTTPAVCTVSGTTVTTLAIGTCTVAATQAGSGSYYPATPADQSFTVHYGFTGFGSPVSDGVLNIANAGRAIPLSWQLLDANGNPITNLSSVQVTSAPMACGTGEATGTAIDAYASGASGLQNLGDGRYQWNWQTPKSYAGTCQLLTVSLGDGTTHTAQFQFS